jgi:hypothetical protein
MADEITITIRQVDLGPEEPEIGLTPEDLKLFDSEGKIRVNVVVDGELVKPAKKTKDSITLKAKPSPDGGTLTISVTTEDGKILNVLQYDGKGEPIDDDPADDETAVIRGIGEAAKEIRDAAGPK